LPLPLITVTQVSAPPILVRACITLAAMPMSSRSRAAGLVALLLASIAAPSCAPQPVGPAVASRPVAAAARTEGTDLSERTRALTVALDDFLSTRFLAHEPGLALLIMKRGSVVFERGYGLADLGTRAPISPTTLFNLGSVTKTFVAMRS
jgi:CubicO group peptidase (beta-lactamase class C family)